MSFNPLDQTGIPVEEQFRNWSELNIDAVRQAHGRSVHPHPGDPDERDRGRVDHVLAPVRPPHRQPRAQARARPEPAGRRAAAEGRQRAQPRRPDAAGDHDRLRAGRGRPHRLAGSSRARSDAASRRSTSRCSRTSTTSTATRTSTTCSTAATPTSHPAPDGDHAGASDVRSSTGIRTTTSARHFETHTVDPLSRMHVMTIVAAEQQTMNFYMNHGTRLDRADRPRPLRRDRHDRGAARHPLRVAARSARLAGSQVGVPRVQRGLPVLVDAPAGERPAHQGRCGSSTATWRSVSCRSPATSCASSRA